MVCKINHKKKNLAAHLEEMNGTPVEKWKGLCEKMWFWKIFTGTEKNDHELGL